MSFPQKIQLVVGDNSKADYRCANFGAKKPDIDFNSPFFLYRDTQNNSSLAEHQAAQYLRVDSYTRGIKQYVIRRRKDEYDEILKKRIESIRNESPWILQCSNDSKKVQSAFKGSNQELPESSSYFVAIPDKFNKKWTLHHVESWQTFTNVHPNSLNQSDIANLDSSLENQQKQLEKAKNIQNFKSKLLNQVENSENNSSDGVSFFYENEIDFEDPDSIRPVNNKSSDSNFLAANDSLFKGNLGLGTAGEDLEIFEGGFDDDEDETTQYDKDEVEAEQLKAQKENQRILELMEDEFDIPEDDEPDVFQEDVEVVGRFDATTSTEMDMADDAEISNEKPLSDSKFIPIWQQKLSQLEQARSSSNPTSSLKINYPEVVKRDTKDLIVQVLETNLGEMSIRNLLSHFPEVYKSYKTDKKLFKNWKNILLDVAKPKKSSRHGPKEVRFILKPSVGKSIRSKRSIPNTSGSMVSRRKIIS